jgi:hypothetical protein
MKSIGTGICALALALGLGSGTAGADQWAKTYGNGAAQNGILFPRTGGFWLQGVVNTAATLQDTQFGSIDAAGSVLWAKQIGGAKNDALGVQPVADGYLVFGSTNSFPAPGYARSNLLWAKYDLSWNQVYANVFGYNARDEEGGFTRTLDGGLLFAGTRTTYPAGADPDGDILLIRTRPDGSIRWKKVFDYGPEDSANQVFELADGFIVSGTLMDPADGAAGILVMKLAKVNGAILWKQLFTFETGGGTTNLSPGAALTKLADGTYLVLGSLLPVNPFAGQTRLVIAKIDGTGAIQWSKSYGSATMNVNAFTTSENTTTETVLVSGPMTVADFTSPNFGNASVLGLTVNLADGTVAQQKRIGALSEYNAGSIIRSGTIVYLTGQHGSSLQDFAQHPKVLYARLASTTLAATWAKTFGGLTKEYGNAMRTGATWAIGGTTYSFGNSTATRGDYFGMTLDATGNYPNCFVNALTLPTANAGITAQALTLATASPTLTAVAVGDTLSTATLTVENADLPSTNFCSPISSAQ